MQLTPEYIDYIAQNPIERNAVRYAMVASFKFFTRITSFANTGKELMFKPFHDIVMSKLEDITYQRNKKRNLALCLPVGSGKSLILEYWVAWNYFRSINMAFVYVSHSDTMITSRSREIKDIIESPFIQSLASLRLKKDERSKVSWSFEGAIDRTGLKAVSLGGGITGLDASVPSIKGFSGGLLLDDPLDAGNALSQVERDNVINAYLTKLETRRRTNEAPTVLVMQRLHVEDLVGWAIKNEIEEWDIVSIPAIDENGNSFWPERYPIKELLRKKELDAYSFNSMYQQNPIVLGGNVIKREWFRYYDYYNNIKFIRIFITADTAQKVKEHNDYSVFSVWGVNNDGLYLLDMVRGKWEAPELEKVAENLWSTWKKGLNGVSCSAFYIEDKVSGTGLIQQLKRKFAIPVIGIQREKDKLTRLMDVINYIESGRVLLPRDRHEITQPLLAEAESFTRDMSHKQDDILDTLIDSIVMGLDAKGKTTSFDPRILGMKK